MRAWRGFMALVCAGFLMSAASPGPDMTVFQLENGLRVILREKPNSPLVGIAVAVNVGIKDESESTSGLVHLLEHLVLLGGTARQNGILKNDEIRSCGGFVNAHTDNDLLTYQASFPAAQLTKALQLVKESVFDLQANSFELAGEKKIILEEIAQIRDDATERGTQLVLQNLFSGHPYGKPLYGNETVIANATLDELARLHRRWFVPANTTLALVGSFDAAAGVRAEIEKIFGVTVAATAPFTPAEIPAIAEPLPKRIDIAQTMDINEAHLFVGFLAPAIDHPDHAAMTVLAHVLGDGPDPLLNSAFRLAGHQVERIAVRYFAFKYGGVMLIHLRLDPDHLPAVSSELLKFLSAASQMSYSEEDFSPQERATQIDRLQSARDQIRLDSEQYQEQGLATALYLARYLHLTDQAADAKKRKAVAEVSSANLRKTAWNWLKGKKHVMVSITPTPPPGK